MGRRKKIPSVNATKTLICKQEEEEEERGRRKKIPSEKTTTKTLICKQEDEDEIGAKGEKGFFACYLLTSLSPSHEGNTYIGFTVNPRRRIRQHNGEIRGGASRTKIKRPWEMVLCIHGFPTNGSALQFEWAWQHPTSSLTVRNAAASFKSFSGIANLIKLAYTMLTLPTWQSMNLTINFFSTKYTKHSSGCPSLPEQMKVQVRSMDELFCYMEGEDTYDDENDMDDEGEECNEVEVANGFTKEELSNVTSKTFVDCHGCFEMPSHERDGWMEENGIRHPSKEDHRHPSPNVDFPLKKLSSYITSSRTEETAKEWGFIKESSIDLDWPIRKRLPTILDDTKDQAAVYTEETAKEGKVRSIEESSIDLDWLIRKRSPVIPAKEGLSIEESSVQPTRKTGDDKGQPAISFTASCEIEVIDVLTPSPSPDCRSSQWSKKRRVSRICADIIDLTRSPAFVQL